MVLLTWLGILFCLSQSAVLSGLNLALFTLSKLELEVEARKGNARAKRILKLRENANFALVTMLWGNVAVNVLLALLSNSVLTGIAAFLFSTVVITIFAEIVPQAYFSRHALHVVAMLSPILRTYQVFLYPIAAPTAWLLNAWLGGEEVVFFRERDLRRVIQLHMDAAESDIARVEGQGALNFLDIDDVPLDDEGEAIDPQSVLQLDFDGNRPLFPPIAPTTDDEFLRSVNRSGKAWSLSHFSRGTGCDEPGVLPPPWLQDAGCVTLTYKGKSMKGTRVMPQGENRTVTHDPAPNKSERSVHSELASQLLESLGASEEQEGAADAPAAAQGIIRDAVRERATDVHLDPDSRGLNVRLRIDGVMRDAAVLPHQQGHRLINQLKSLGGIDPVAQFHADEARFAFQEEGGEVDLRLAVIPCLHGQKLTLRVLDPRQLVYSIEELGLCDRNLGRIRHWFTSLGGMFLVAGPVGSGKTTTLYALLHALKLQTCSVSTLEDPVEYSVDGINQVQVDEEHGLTFARGIKALARHDPDVILVGELRDPATALAAYGAAALGRTILATLHARDAAGAVTSLRYYGLSDRDIATTLSMVVAQRLVRKLCPKCRRETSPTDTQKRWFDVIQIALPETSWEPVGCDDCRQSGYFGRTGVFEVWQLDEGDYHRLLDGATERDVRNSLASRSHTHFLADALEKAEAGATTLAEVQRLRLAGPAFPARDG